MRAEFDLSVETAGSRKLILSNYLGWSEVQLRMASGCMILS